MIQKPKIYFNWSSGKDASLALYHLQKEGKYSVERLLTSMNSHHDRVSMHGLRRELLDQQIKSIGIPGTTIELPEEPTMEDYNQIMSDAVMQLKSDGFADCGFGDIFLEDLRAFREEKLKPYDITAHFPLWKRDTKEIISEFIELGFKAVVLCVKSDLLDESFVGREVDQSFINDLPSNVDPCGENGEFHTFCYDGPIFSEPVKFEIGENVYRSYTAPKNDDEKEGASDLGFWFCDLIPV